MQCKIAFKLVTCQLVIVFFCLVFMHAHAALDAPHNISTATGCLSCHQMTSTYPKLLPPLNHTAQDPDDTISNNVCWSCHYGSPGAPFVQTHSSLQTDNGYGDWTVECWVCHNQHLQEQNRYNGSTFGKYIRRSVNLANITGLTKTGSKTVKFTGETGPNSFADGEGLAEGICEVCHTQTSQWRNDGTLAGVGVHTGLQGSNCMRCHPHTEGFRADYTCLDCHQDSMNNRAAVGQQFGGNSHHVQTGTPITSDKCYQCHWEADAGGRLTGYHNATAAAAVDLVIYGIGARPESYNIGTTAVAYTADGSRAQILSLNTHCLGCHRDPNNATQPFGDGKTPNQYAWDESSAGAGDGTSIDARYSQTDIDDTTTWGKYSSTTYPGVTPKDNRVKAFSAHGNAVNNEGGWDLNETWPNTRNGGTNVACFDCHNSHGSTVAGTTTSYASATTNGGILKETAAGKGGYSVTYKPEAGGSAENKNLHNAAAGLCFDCHMTQDSGTTPWGFQSTFGASQPIMSYWESPYWDGGESAFASQQRYPFKRGQGNMGGHFGVSSPLASGDGTSPINGLCTPCHDPHGVSPTMGANAPYAVPLLKGTWVTSPYKEDTAPESNSKGTSILGLLGYHIDQNTFGSQISNTPTTAPTQTASQFAGLCLKCHPKSSLTNGTIHTWKDKNRIHEAVKGWKTTPGKAVQHNYTCSKCHAPHNSSLPRLMVTNCLNSKHKGGNSFNDSPVISGSGSGGKVWCVSDNFFPGSGFYSGSGAGSFPGSYNSDVKGVLSVSCHEGDTGSPTDESWNTKTNWAWGPETLSPDALPLGYHQLTMTITGIGFQNGATVSFNDAGITAGPVTFVDSTTLTVPVTVGASVTASAYDATVTNPDGIIGIGKKLLAINPLPTVSWWDPYKIPRGSIDAVVSINGGGFQQGILVSFNDPGITTNAVTVCNGGSSMIARVTVGQGAMLGPHNVTLTNPDGGSVTVAGRCEITLDPIVRSASPNSLPQGSPQTTITITGDNFRSDATVSFNDPNIILGPVSVLDPTTLTIPVTVNPGAILGAHDISIETSSGAHYGVGSGIFTVAAGPLVNSISPASAVQGSPQMTVTITGTDFQDGATVSFNDPNIQQGQVTFVDSTTLTVPLTVEANATGGPHNVTVTNPDGGEGNGSFMVIATAPPTVTSSSPGSRGQNSLQATVTITGTGFENGATVSFSGANITLGTVTFMNSTTLTVPVTIDASATPGARDITVTNPDGGVGTGTGLFTVTPAPTVTSTSPDARAQGSFATETITGTGFQNGATVSFNDPNIVLDAVNYVDSTTLTVTAAVGYWDSSFHDAALGVHDVTVTNPDGGSGTGTGLFTVTATPSITSISPGSIPQGNAQVTLTITGSGFLSGAAVSVSNVDAFGATTFVDSTTLSVPVTVGVYTAPGTHTLSVTNPDGGVAEGSFTVAQGPQVTSTSPNSVLQGTAPVTVTISGSGFQSGATVSLGAANANGILTIDPNITLGTVTFVNSTTLTVPVSASINAWTGAHDVMVTNPNTGSGIGKAVFTVVANPPNPTSISPNSRFQNSGQVTLEIYGSGFQSGATALLIMGYDGPMILGTTTFVSSTHLTLSITLNEGSQPAGTYNVVVTNPDGGEGVGLNLFTVTAPPTVTSASPDSIPQGKAWAGSVTVTITGTGFDYFPTVSFNDPNITLAASPQVVNSTTMTVRVRVFQDATVGAHDITVTNQDGGSGTGIGVFTVTAGPQPISASPSSICQGAGVILTITGTGFQNGVTISSYNGGVTFGAVTYQDSTTLTIPVTVAPNAGIGPFELIVTNPDGGMAVASLFSITAPPTVTATSPGILRQGSVETTVTITGTGFASGATVSFNNADIATGAVAFVNATTLTVPVTVGAGATIGPHDVTVTNPDGGSGNGSGVFTVISELIVNSVSPDALALGSPETTVTISGEYFQDGATVSFNDPNITLGPVAFVDPQTLTVPVTVGEGAWPGPHDVTVTNPDGESVTGGVFTVISAPVVSSVSPNSLALGSPETTVTIIGNNFDPGSAVSFNDPNITVGPVMFVDPMTLTVPVTVVPGAWIGPHGITVTNPDGGSGTGFGVFTVTPAI